MVPGLFLGRRGKDQFSQDVVEDLMPKLLEYNPDVVAVVSTDDDYYSIAMCASTNAVVEALGAKFDKRETVEVLVSGATVRVLSFFIDSGLVQAYSWVRSSVEVAPY